MNNKQWIKETIAHSVTGRVPWNMSFSPPAMEAVQKYYGVENIYKFLGLESCFNFNHSIITDDTINDEIHNAFKQINAETRDMFEKDEKEADKAYLAACKEAGIEAAPPELFNGKDCLYDSYKNYPHLTTAARSLKFQ